MRGCGYITVLMILLLLWLLWYREKKQGERMQRIDHMIDEAAAGTFSEQYFDESILSKIEMKFAEYLRRTEESEKRREIEKARITELISDISHQTKTPIANLLLYTALLKEEELSASEAESVAAIHRQAEKLSFLVDALLKLSRLENGIIRLFPEKRKLSELFDSIRIPFCAQAERKGLIFEIREEDCSAVYDLKWTAEALGNILDNAVKYTEKGTITVSVKPYELFVRLDITDTGPGVSPGEREKIFSRFYRSPLVREQSGLGIGLCLARGILSAEGGYIKVSPNDPAGSVFSVFLPRA